MQQKSTKRAFRDKFTFGSIIHDHEPHAFTQTWFISQSAGATVAAANKAAKQIKLPLRWLPRISSAASRRSAQPSQTLIQVSFSPINSGVTYRYKRNCPKITKKPGRSTMLKHPTDASRMKKVDIIEGHCPPPHKPCLHIAARRPVHRKIPSSNAHPGSHHTEGSVSGSQIANACPAGR